jgi:hypothetical protein
MSGPKSSGHPVTKYDVLFVNVCPVVPMDSAAKDKSICPPTIAYVRSRRENSQNAFLADLSDPKSNLTLELSYLSLVNYLVHYSTSTYYL